MNRLLIIYKWVLLQSSKKQPFIGMMEEEKIELISLQVDSTKSRTIILVQYFTNLLSFCTITEQCEGQAILTTNCIHLSVIFITTFKN